MLLLASFVFCCVLTRTGVLVDGLVAPPLKTQAASVSRSTSRGGRTSDGTQSLITTRAAPAKTKDEAIVALQTEVDEKRRLNAKLERELDLALEEATQAEAERRLAVSREEEAKRLAEAATEAAKMRAQKQAEVKINSEKMALERAKTAETAAKNATRLAIERAAAPTLAQGEAARAETARVLETLSALRAERDAAVAAVESEAASKIDRATRKVEAIVANTKRDADAVMLAYGMAATAGGLLVGDQLGLGPSAGLVGAGLGAAAMFLWGVQKTSASSKSPTSSSEE